MDPRGTLTFGLTTMAIAAVAAASQARALEIEQVLGRWSVMEYDQCTQPEDSDDRPIRIARVEDGYDIGNYGWLCSVKTWKKDGAFLVGEAKDCGEEGGGETFDDTFVLSLNARDELLMDREATSGLRRCPAEQPAVQP
ncbi:MAG: hypothetical protein LCH46_13130 [Proteobacteria bacterium]|nr:hypothetical protein [Pseudomonadota bacterium]